MGGIVLVTGLILTWAVFRIWSGRVTLPPSVFLVLFTCGAAASVLGIILERIAYFGFEFDTVGRALAAPVDEICKALPLFVVLIRFPRWRSLTIADYTLTGLAGALGYEFVNWDFAVLGGMTPLSWHHWIFGSLFTESEWEHDPTYFAGAATAAFAGMVTGITVRIAARRRAALIAALVAVLAMTFENAMFRWQAGPLLWVGYPAHLTPVFAGFRWLYAAMLHGRIEIVLLGIALPIASWLEGRWIRFATPGAPSFLLVEDASVPLVAAEYLIAVRRLTFNWTAFIEVTRFFRDRRAYALVEAEAARRPTASDLLAEAAERKQNLTARFARMDAEPTRARWGDMAGLSVRAIAANRFWMVLILLLGLYALVRAPAWGVLRPLFYSDWTALAFIIFAAAILLHGYLQDHTTGASEPAEFRSSLLPLAVAAIAFALLAYPARYEFLVPHSGGSRLTALEPFERWATGSGYPDYGGNPHVFFALIALVLAICAGWRGVPARQTAKALSLAAANAAEKG